MVLGGEEKGTVVVLTRTTATGAAAAPVAMGSALETALFGCSGSAEGPPARGGRRAEQRDEDAEVGEVAAPEISGRGTSEACHPGASGGDDANLPDSIRAGYLRSSEEKAGSSPGGRRR